VPFLVCWPGQLKPGETQTPVIQLDVLPTALAAAGVTAPTDKPFDGVNLLPILRGDSPPPVRDLFWCSGSEDGWWAIRSGPWKLVSDRGRVGLFDLERDIAEAHDLAAQRPELVAELTRKHDAWLSAMAPPMPERPPRRRRRPRRRSDCAVRTRVPRSMNGLAGMRPGSA
jgi:arylsulfatase A-like enzyme